MALGTLPSAGRDALSNTTLAIVALPVYVLLLLFLMGIFGKRRQ